jgi:hypothetical protein
MQSKLKIGELLVEAGVIDAAQLTAALGEQRQWGERLGMTLVRMGMLDEDTLVQTLASQLKMPVVKLGGKRVNPDVLARVPHELAMKARCIPLLVNDEGGQQVLYLGMEDPSNLDALDEIGFRLGGVVKPVLVAPSELDEALERHGRWGEEGEPEGVDASGPVGNEAGFGDEGFGEGFAVSPLDCEMEAEAPAAQNKTPDAVSQAAILRALSQLLVEKGIITRDEFVERVRAAMREDAGET